MRDRDHHLEESAKDQEKEIIEMTEGMKREEEIRMNAEIGQETDIDGEAVKEVMIENVE